MICHSKKSGSGVLLRISGESSISSVVYESPSCVPADLWRKVVSPTEVFAGLDVLRILERTWTDRKQIWPVLMFDQAGEPVAAACLFGHTVDFATTGNQSGSRIINRVRRLWPGFMHIKTLVCGLPIPVGNTGIHLVPGVDGAAVSAALSRLLRQIAWKRWFQGIMIRDIDAGLVQQTKHLEDHGFMTVDAPPQNIVPIEHRGLDEWLASLRSHYRYAWKKNLRKVDEQGLRCEYSSGREILDIYTRDVHRLYADLEKSQRIRFERMPRRFFRLMVEVLGDQVHLTRICRGNETLAFCWALQRGDIYQNMLCGFNQELNSVYDLYFNLAVRDMANGMRLGAREVWLGQTTNRFKARLGAKEVSRKCHVRGVKPAMMYLKANSRWLLPESQLPQQRNLIRRSSPSTSARNAINSV